LAAMRHYEYQRWDVIELRICSFVLTRYANNT